MSGPRNHAVIVLTEAEHTALLHELRGLDLGDPLSASALRKLRGARLDTLGAIGGAIVTALREPVSGDRPVSILDRSSLSNPRCQHCGCALTNWRDPEDPSQPDDWRDAQHGSDECRENNAGNVLGHNPIICRADDCDDPALVWFNGNYWCGAKEGHGDP